MDALNVAHQAARAALEKKAIDTRILDLRGISDICQFQVTCSGANERQNVSICSHIESFLRQHFAIRPMTVEGKRNGQWIVLDFGPTIVHIFAQEVRQYYAIDSLWPKAKLVSLTDGVTS